MIRTFVKIGGSWVETNHDAAVKYLRWKNERRKKL